MTFWRAFRVLWGVGWPLAAAFFFLRDRGRARRRKPAALKPPVPDGALEGWRRAIGEAIGSEVGRVQGHVEGHVGVPREAALVAFRSRYALEREVRGLWERAFGEVAPRRGMTLLLEPLVAAGALRPEMAEVIAVVSRMASPAVHAQGISEEKVRFLQEVVPGLAAAVREVRRPPPQPSP